MTSFPSTLTLLRRAPQLVRAASHALLDPTRGDMVAQVGDLTSDAALARLRRRLRSSAGGRALLDAPPSARFPASGSATLAEYRALGAGTLGRSYAEFMDTRSFTPESRSAVDASILSMMRPAAPAPWPQAPAGATGGGGGGGGPGPRGRQEEEVGGSEAEAEEIEKEMVFILQRYRDVHDLWHVLTGCATTVAGEVAQKWFEAVHTGLPVAWLSATAGPVRMSAAERRLLVRRGIPWAVHCGMEATDLLAIRYEDFMDVQVSELRSRWNVTKAPDMKRM